MVGNHGTTCTEASKKTIACHLLQQAVSTKLSTAAVCSTCPSADCDMQAVSVDCVIQAITKRSADPPVFKANFTFSSEM